MPNPPSRRRSRSSALLLLACLAGCSVSSKYMTKLERPEPIEVSATEATVVFVRPSGWAGGAKITVLDQNGRFLGESWGETYYAVRMPPGQYTFTAWTEGTHALRADVAAGHIYYVELAPTVGWWSARLRLRAIKPGGDAWAELPGWLAESTMLVPQPNGQEYVDSRRDRVGEVTSKGLATFEAYDDATKAERTLAAGDGVVKAPVR